MRAPVLTAATNTIAGSAVASSAVHLPYSSFELQCRALAALYPDFSWRPPISRFHSDTGFLQSTRQQLDSTTLSERHRPVVPDEELQMATHADVMELHESDLLAIAPPLSSSLLEPFAAVWCEWHVVYSNTYRVPVLLFQFTLADGQPLDSEQVMAAIQQHSDGRSSSLVLDAAHNTELPPVSCISHPALCRPFYCLHPCQTARVMALLQSEPATRDKDEGALNVLAWLSAVGPFVGLRLTLNSALQQVIASRVSTG